MVDFCIHIYIDVGLSLFLENIKRKRQKKYKYDELIGSLSFDLDLEVLLNF